MDGELPELPADDVSWWVPPGSPLGGTRVIEGAGALRGGGSTARQAPPHRTSFACIVSMYSRHSTILPSRARIRKW